MKKRIIYLFSFIIAFLLLESVVFAQNQGQEEIVKIKDLLDDELYWSVDWEDGIIIIEAKKEKAAKEIKQRLKMCNPLDTEKVQVKNPKKLSLKELEDARNRVLIQAPLLDICSVEIDENKNAIILKSWKGSWIDDKLQKSVAEISHVIFQRIPKEGNEMINDTSSYMDNFSDENKNRHQLRMDGGRILKNKIALDIDGVFVTDEEIKVSVIQLDKEKEEKISQIAGKSADKLSFVSRKERTKRAFYKNLYYMKEGENYIATQGVLIELEHKPYRKNGYLMIPIEEIYEVLNGTNASLHRYRCQWIGKEKKQAEFYNSRVKIYQKLWLEQNEIVCFLGKNNVFTTKLEGKAEITDGVLYLPYSEENLELYLYLLWLPSKDLHWDVYNSQTNTFQWYG